jgi:pyruvate formate lyase activating enzyme
MSTALAFAGPLCQNQAERSGSWEDPIPVAGLVPLTTVDYPNRLAMTVFTQGCPWRCPYCHNAGLRQVGQPVQLRWRRICDVLDRRRGCLEAVVFSGGEPTMQADLGTALQAVRERGFLTGLHTAGMFPERLRRWLPWLDWVGLDIKAPFDDRYARLTGDPSSAAKTRASLDLLMAAGIPFQLRTTVANDADGESQFGAVCRQLRELGAPEPVRQSLRTVKTNADSPL